MIVEAFVLCVDEGVLVRLGHVGDVDRDQASITELGEQRAIGGVNAQRRLELVAAVAVRLGDLWIEVEEHTGETEHCGT